MISLGKKKKTNQLFYKDFELVRNKLEFGGKFIYNL